MAQALRRAVWDLQPPACHTEAPVLTLWCTPISGTRLLRLTGLPVAIPITVAWRRTTGLVLAEGIVLWMVTMYIKSRVTAINATMEEPSGKVEAAAPGGAAQKRGLVYSIQLCNFRPSLKGFQSDL